MLSAVPPWIVPTWQVVQGGSNSASIASRSRARFSAFIRLAQSTSFAASITAFTPVCISELCTSWPRRWVAMPMPPLWPLTTFISEGSPIIAAAARGSRSAISAIIRGAPRQPTSSSKDSAICSGRLRLAFSAFGTAASAIASNPFMSQVPRP